MRRNYNYDNYGGHEEMMNRDPTEDRQMAFVKLLQKQSEVIERLSDRVGGQGQAFMDTYEESYDDVYAAPGPMRMRPRGMGGSSMMESYSGNMRDMGMGMGVPLSSPGGPMGPRSRGQPEPRGPMSSRGQPEPRGPMSSRGPVDSRGPRDQMGPRYYDQGSEKNDPKYLKQCKQYIASIKKNIPTNKDHLSVYCAACSFLAKNNQEFFSHRSTPAHVRQMDKVQEMPDMIRKEVKKVVDAVHIERSQQKSLMFCDMCDEKLRVPYSDHKNIVSHQLRSKAARAGCIPCKTGPMKNYTAYKAHCATETHINISEVYQKNMDQKIESCTQQKDFPPFREGILFGTNRVKETSGFFCTLCRKFLLNEEEKHEHTKLQRHFNHVRDEFFNIKRTEPVDKGDYTLPSQTKMETKEETRDTTNGNQEEENKEEEKQEEENKEEAMETTET